MSKLRNSQSEMFGKIIKHPKCNLKIVQNWWQILAMKFIFSKVTNSLIPTTFRSSGPQVFLRKGVLKICNKYTGEHPCRSVIWIKLLCNFIEIPLSMGVFLWIYCVFSEHLFLGTLLGGCFWAFLQNNSIIDSYFTSIEILRKALFLIIKFHSGFFCFYSLKNLS